MKKTSLAHGSSLRRAFRQIIVASMVVPPTILAFACAGGGDDGGTDSGSGGTSTSSSGSTATSSGSTEPCSAVPTDAPACGEYFVTLRGDPSTCEFGADGMGSIEYCSKICGGGYVQSCRRATNLVNCKVPCAIDGRRYAALDDRCAPSGRDVPSYLARMAFFEAASVDAFALLERELETHGAPSAMVRSCARARRDETKHARMAARLARRHGAAFVEPPRLEHAPTRSLEAIATENAVEGCVRETFGVLLGMWQAEHAPTSALRTFFATLATDEARHAALAERIDEWILPRLAPAARRRVDAARAEAFARLEASLAATPAAGLGLPTAAEAKMLFSRWQTELGPALAA